MVRYNDMGNKGFNSSRHPRGSRGRGIRGVRHGRDNGSHLRRSAQNRLINSRAGLSSSTDNFQSAATGNVNLSRNPVEYCDGSYTTTNNGRSRRNTDKRTFRYGYKALTNLLSRPPEEIIMDFLAKKVALKELMASHLEPDIIVLLTHVIATACGSKFTANLAEVLMLVLDDDYLEQLLQYVLQLPLQEEQDKITNKVFWEKVEEFWNSLWIVFSQLHERLPTIAVDVLPKLVNAAVYTVQNFELRQDVSISSSTLAKFKELDVQLGEAVKAAESGKAKRGKGACDEENPPDDFRVLSIYPRAEELGADARPFVRSNIVEGSYRDVEHYLDVQFRLLREDFVAPLRNGINEFLCQDGKKKRLSNIKIYPNVKFIRMERNQNQIGHIVQVMNPGQMKNVDRTKRFMFGSLVCFTADNFRTILFGTVINRDKEKLRRGEIVVAFAPDISLDPQVKYTMAECAVYFEPYYQVLSALQKMDQNDFPLKTYLIDVNFVSEMPDYVRQSPVFNIGSFEVNVTLSETWPRHDQIQLNESQFEAFKFALNNKMSIIQGPPGTGKTYLALKIAKMLLANHTKWEGFGPILLICYTNHALDQFLEGLLDTTEHIVRVGGQSKSEKMANFNIKELRKKIYMGDKQVLRQKKDEIHDLVANIQGEVTMLDRINKFESVLKFDSFYFADEAYETSWFATATTDNILKWLLEESNQEEWARANWNIKPIVFSDEDEFDNDYIDERTQNIVDIEDDFLKNLCVAADYGHIEMVTLKNLQKEEEDLAKKLKKLRPRSYKHFLTAKDYNRAVINKEYLKYRLHQLRTGQLNVSPAKIDLDNPYKMSFNDRWRLYATWLARYREKIEKDIRDKDEKFKTVYTKYDELRDMCDARLLRNNLVIGMTTTAAARLQTLLQALKCPIVIVEEAAEVLESHVITSLTSSCQQLLMIGDHKQLRPSTADYRMDVHYHLGISLFERMIKNDFPCQTLNVQHRMRPEIAALVAPVIYPDLRNHESVLNFEEIKGVDKSLYFITHQHAEQISADQSKENPHEAAFLLQLAQYLVLNGYGAEKITLLVAYSAQLFLLLKERVKYPQLKDLSIKVVDNYQGEENDIILLSLVRNNSEGMIGFLHLENRVCVALSRARKGLYVMGNMDLLCEKSKIWPKIREVFEGQNAIGDFLLLRCQKHPDQETEAKCGNDFKKVPEGGCMKPCGDLLDCGHICDRLCHIEKLPCEKPCAKVLCEFDHVCPKICWEVCENCMVPKHAVLPCGHEHYIPCHLSPEDVNCLTVIDATLPCGHATRKECYLDVNLVLCGAKCDVRVEPCGHSCLRNCHINDDPNHEEYKCMKNCERQNKFCLFPDNVDHQCRKRCYQKCTPCDIKVNKTKTLCQHTFNVNCTVDVDKWPCRRNCSKILACGHNCKRKCHEVCGGCNEMVEKIVEPCGHKVKCACSKTPTRSLCQGKCQLQLKCGHKCTRTCGEICNSVLCEVLAVSNISCPQGHNIIVPCYLSNETQMSNELLSYCKEKCTAQLECGHICSGTCSSCSQGRVHVDCKQRCNKILVCGHKCAAACHELCQPCKLWCTYKCGHSKCTKKCGTSCRLCRQPCKRRCPHVQCRKKCHEICDVGPCTEPCPKRLKCRHKCIGFCGDTCPPLCRTCDAKTVTECFFGTEDDEGSRFVYLPNCKHVLESSGFEQWLQTCQAEGNDKEISVVRCPKCKEVIKNLQRYDEFLKSSLKDVATVMKKFNGSDEANNALLKTLLTDVQNLASDMEQLGTKNFYTELKLTLEKCKSKLNQQQLQSYAMKIQILQQLCDTFKSVALTKREAKAIVHKHLRFLLGYLHEKNDFINNQRRNDMELELKRFTRVVQLATIVEKSENCSAHPEYKKCQDLAFSFLRYNDETDAELKSELSKLSEKSKGGLNITDAEKREIVKGMNVGVGHWFKCPNGHIYLMSKCGGVNQANNCPECG